jgi:FkbM family methyltransferase
MHPVEKVAIAVRHSRVLEGSSKLWNLVRPWYIRSLAVLGRGAVRRMINGTDPVFLSPELYGVPETYEPEMWELVMAEVRPGDAVADVGASIGLYTLAFAHRVGPTGQVYSFEPDRESFDWLSRNVDLNGVGEWVHLYCCAVGDVDGVVAFAGGRSTESSVLQAPSPGSSRVESVRLDSVFADKKLALLKIDVEGFEEKVLWGGEGLLRDAERAPRTIVIEVHPFAWERFGLSDCSLLETLADAEYSVSDLSGSDVESIDAYGVIVARRSDGGDGGG